MKKPRRLSWFGSLRMIDVNLLGVRTGANGTQHKREIGGERKSCRMSLSWIRVAKGKESRARRALGIEFATINRRQGVHLGRECDNESATRRLTTTSSLSRRLLS